MNSKNGLVLLSLGEIGVLSGAGDGAEAKIYRRKKL